MAFIFEETVRKVVGSTMLNGIDVHTAISSEECIVFIMSRRHDEDARGK